MPSPGEYFIGRPICLTWPMPLCSLAAGRVEPQPTGAQQRGQPGGPTTSRKTRGSSGNPHENHHSQPRRCLPAIRVAHQLRLGRHLLGVSDQEETHDTGITSSGTGPSPQRARVDRCAAEHSQTNTVAALGTRRCPYRSRRRHRGDPPTTRIDVRHTRRAMASRFLCCPRQKPAPVHARCDLHGRRPLLRDSGAGRSGVSDLTRSNTRAPPSLRRSELRQRSSPRLHSTRLARPSRTRLTPWPGWGSTPPPPTS